MIKGHGKLAILLGLAGLGGLYTAAWSAGDDFYAGMNEAMGRMHAGMRLSPSGDVDRDFAEMMIPHHQGAVDMAVLELRFGRDPRLKRLAQEIVVTQRQEIQLMKSTLARQGNREGNREGNKGN
jgi:uncharacterized protein (DUF305 family)